MARKWLWGVPLLIVLGILIAGMLKMNFADVPYVGAPETYVSPETGETIEVRQRADESLSVRIFEIEGDYMKGFEAKPVQSASGAKYQSRDKRFTFRRKGHEAMVFHGDDKIFSGEKLLRPKTD